MSVSTPQADLSAAESGLVTLQGEQASVGSSLTNVGKATTLKAAHASAATGLQRQAAAESTAAGVSSNVRAALAAINVPVPTSGPWNLIFEDTWAGTVLSGQWQDHNGWKNQNGVIDNASNVIVNDGLSLVLSDQQTGAAIETTDTVFAVGCYAEASVWFPGNGTDVFNWPAWWASGPNWPAAGENDIAEGLGTLTVNYHSPSGAHNQGTVPGVWTNAFHTYGIYRGPSFAVVYWDGLPVEAYPTDDDRAPESLIFTMGLAPGTPASDTVTGAASAMKARYVRVWSSQIP